MPEEEVLGDPQEDVVELDESAEGTVEADGEAEDDDVGYVENPDGSIRYDDGYFISANGTHYDGEGNVIQTAPEADEPEDVVPEPVRKPVKPVAKAPQPKPVTYTPPPASYQVFDETNMWQPGEFEKFEEMKLDEPYQAAIYHQNKLKQLENYANQVFETNLDHLEENVPEAKSYSRQIARAMANLSFRDRQNPEAPKRLLAQAIANDIVNSPDKLTKILRPQVAEAPKKAAVAPVRKAATPVERRVPTPNNVRRSPVQSQKSGRPKSAGYNMLKTTNPDLTEEQISLLLKGRR